MKRYSFLALASVLLLSVLCVYSVSQAANTIKVGIVDTYTGPATTFTNDVLDGFKLAVQKINASGGILGRKIEYTTRDEKFKPDIGLAMAKELVLKEKVDILMGTINSATTLAISDFVRKEKIPFFVTFAKSDKIVAEKGHRYIFNMNENTEMAGRAAAIALAKKPYVKYWIAGDDYEYGHAIAEGVWDNLKKQRSFPFSPPRDRTPPKGSTERPTTSSTIPTPPRTRPSWPISRRHTTAIPGSVPSTGT